MAMRFRPLKAMYNGSEHLKEQASEDVNRRVMSFENRNHA